MPQWATFTPKQANVSFPLKKFFSNKILFSNNIFLQKKVPEIVDFKFQGFFYQIDCFEPFW